MWQQSIPCSFYPAARAPVRWDCLLDNTKVTLNKGRVEWGTPKQSQVPFEVVGEARGAEDRGWGWGVPFRGHHIKSIPTLEWGDREGWTLPLPFAFNMLVFDSSWDSCFFSRFVLATRMIHDSELCTWECGYCSPQSPLQITLTYTHTPSRHQCGRPLENKLLHTDAPR